MSGILERRGHLMADALLVLMPGVGIPGRFNFHTYQTDSDGSFEIPCVKPGTYRALVFEGGAEVAYANPRITDPLLPRAPTIEVRPREAVTRRIEVVQ